MSALYSGVADFGRIYATIGLVFGLIVGVAFIVAGTYILTRKDSETNSKQGWVFIAIGIIVGLIAWLIWHFTRVSKAFAAAEGVYGGIEIVKDLFRN